MRRQVSESEVTSKNNERQTMVVITRKRTQSLTLHYVDFVCLCETGLLYVAMDSLFIASHVHPLRKRMCVCVKLCVRACALPPLVCENIPRRIYVICHVCARVCVCAWCQCPLHTENMCINENTTTHSSSMCKWYHNFSIAISLSIDSYLRLKLMRTPHYPSI